MVHFRFIADVHLGKLAKDLRILGFDTLYNNAWTNKELLQLAIEQNRVLLSRNPAFVNEQVPFLHIKTEEPKEQLKQVLAHYHLKDKIQPFTRCLLCNGSLVPVAKEKIANQLQPNTNTYYNEFWKCANCSQVYWKGSHYNRMMQLVNDIKSQ